MKVDIYSDVACPWCYVGKQRFEKAIAAFSGREGVEVQYRPFQLDPTLPTDPAEAQPQREALTRRYGPGFAQMEARLAEVAKADGIDYQGGKVLAANTLAAHRVMAKAFEVGGVELQAKVKAALFHAYFTEGQNVADPAVLAHVADGAGLAAGTVTALLATDALTNEVEAQIEEARSRGITSVPTFVFEDRWVVAGAQEVETFLQALTAITENLQAEAGQGHACDDEACSI